MTDRLARVEKYIISEETLKFTTRIEVPGIITSSIDLPKGSTMKTNLIDLIKG